MAQGDEVRAGELLTKAYKERRLSDSEDAEVISIRDSNRSSDNMNAMCRAARDLAGRHRFEPWTVTWPEFGSIMYDSWTLAAICALPQWSHVCRAYAAWAFLHRVGSVETIELATLEKDDASRGTVHRFDRNHGLNNYKGPISVWGASRQFKNFSRSAFPERAVAGRLVHALQTGDKSCLISDHPKVGWAWEIIAENLSAFDGWEDWHTSLSGFRVRHTQRYWLWRYSDGRVISLAEKTTASTRAPATQTEGDPTRKSFRLSTPSVDTGSGSIWTRVNGSTTDSEWILEDIPRPRNSRPPRIMRGSIPANPEISLIWDSDGLRVEGGHQGPNHSEELTRALGKISQLITGFRNEGPMRDLIHHVSLLYRDDVSDAAVARQAVRGAAARIEPSGHRGPNQNTEVVAVLGTIDGVIRGFRNERPMRDLMHHVSLLFKDDENDAATAQQAAPAAARRIAA